MHKLRISDTTRKNILAGTIEPYYQEKIKSDLKDKICWERTSKFFETSSKILTLFGGIFSVAAGIFNVGLFSSSIYTQPILSFVSAALSAASLVFSQFAAWASKQSKEEINSVNTLLKELGIALVPDDIGINYIKDAKDIEMRQLVEKPNQIHENSINDILITGDVPNLSSVNNIIAKESTKIDKNKDIINDEKKNEEKDKKDKNKENNEENKENKENKDKKDLSLVRSEETELTRTHVHSNIADIMTEFKNSLKKPSEPSL